jgi:hypothetical protein
MRDGTASTALCTQHAISGGLAFRSCSVDTLTVAFRKALPK